MRVDRKPVVHMFANAMVRFARLVRRIDVDDHQRQIIQTVKELMADLRRDCMRLRNRQLGIDRDVQFGMQAVPEPTRAHLGDLLHLRHMFGGVAKFVDNVRLGAVEHAEKIDLPLWMTMPRIAAVMSSPMIGSASG